MTRSTRGHGLDLNAPGAIDALLAFHRARFGDARMEADGDGDGGGSSNEGDTGDGGGEGDGGGSAPKAEDTVEYWRKRARQHENEAKRLRDRAGKSGQGEGERPKADAPRERDDSGEKAVRKARLLAVKAAAVDAGVNPRLATALVGSNRGLLDSIELDEDTDDPTDPKAMEALIKGLVDDYSLPTTSTSTTSRGTSGSGRKHPSSGADGGSRPPATTKSEAEEDEKWERENGFR